MKNKTSTSNLGAVISVRGSVVDRRFDEHLPPIYSVLHAGDGGNRHRSAVATRRAPGARDRADPFGARGGSGRHIALLAWPQTMRPVLCRLRQRIIKSRQPLKWNMIANRFVFLPP